MIGIVRIHLHYILQFKSIKPQIHFTWTSGKWAVEFRRSLPPSLGIAPHAGTVLCSILIFFARTGRIIFFATCINIQMKTFFP